MDTKNMNRGGQSFLILDMVLLLVFFVASPSASEERCSDSIHKTTPTSQFSSYENGTVQDHSTNLMWAKCAEGLSGMSCETGSESLFTWQEALDRANQSTLASYSNWRLPNIKELASILEISCGYPSINLSIFPGTSSANFWSSTPYSVWDNRARVVRFSNAWIAGYEHRDEQFPIRLVRSMQ